MDELEAEEPLERGTLLVPPAAHGIAKIGAKRRPWQAKHCLLFGASERGIERLEIYDSRDDEAAASASQCRRIVALERCIKISASACTITIVGFGETHELGAQSEADARRWARALRSVAFGDDRRPKRRSPEAQNKENDLYCFAGEGSFAVRLCASDASERCGLEPADYTLVMTATAIELRGADAEARRLFATWPYRYVRRYGYRRGRFTFEAGRKCETGEGAFHLEHPNQSELFRCLSLKLQRMKKLIKGRAGGGGESTLDWSAEQFRSASLMDPRSRSPLPPSDEFEPIKPLPPPPETKPKPVKPPRKNVFAVAKERFEAEFGDGQYKRLDEEDAAPGAPGPYDRVEVRSEAWRTLGIDDVDHSEFRPEVPSRAAPPPPPPPPPASRSHEDAGASTTTLDGPRLIFLRSPSLDPDDADYDRLEHFGSTSRLDKPDGYRAVFARPAATTTTSVELVDDPKGAWSDYDEVETVMQAVRLADDSHLGYGALRKPSVPGPQVPIKAKPPAETHVEQCAFEESSYAIVSKPKQV